MACSSDSWLRLPMPLGPFNEPLGTDCYWNVIGFSVFGAFVLVTDVIAFLCVSGEVLHARNRLQRANMFAQSVSVVANFVMVSVAFATQDYGFVFFGVFLFTMALVIPLTEAFFFTSTMSTIAKVSKKGLVDILGGKRAVSVGVFIFIPAWICAVIGSLGLIVSGVNAKTNPGAVQTFWSVVFAGWSALTCVIVAQFSYGFHKFATVIEQAIETTKGMTSSHVNLQDMRDLAQRFRKTSRNLFLALPLGCGVNVLHAIILPGFWFLILLHSINFSGSFVITWWAAAPMRRRAKLFPCLFSAEQRALMAKVSNKVSSNKDTPMSATGTRSPTSPFSKGKSSKEVDRQNSNGSFVGSYTEPGSAMVVDSGEDV